MATPGSITQYLADLQAGDPVAAQRLWEAYFQRLVELARRRLRAVPRTAADEEDVALSAFDSFLRSAGQARFPKLNDRDDLWQVLLLITQRKASDLIEHESRGKRDWRRLQPGENVQPTPLADLAGSEPDPAFAAEVADQCRRLLNSLADDTLRTIAIRKMEGYASTEIAAELHCSLATVERRLRLIRKEWEAELAPGAAGG
jgi:DNA-directed RNA polymerase specialized sigma24 family protein